MCDKKFICEICFKEFDNSRSLNGHKSGHKRLGKFRKEFSIKREKLKRLAEEKADPNFKPSCKYCKKEFERKSQLGGHYLACKMNPNISEETRLERIAKKAVKVRGRKLTTKQKRVISEGMKKAHAEGRAWNIGKSRWNSLPSYPEQFFMEVIENEFEDKNYVREFPLGIYSLDFAWPEKMIAIEIDGDQHQRFEEYKRRDERKDAFAESQGWEILRMSWSFIFNNTKESIQICKDFINTKISEERLLKIKMRVSIQSKSNKKDKEILNFIESESRTNLILNSSINFSHFGWVNKIAKELNVSPQYIGRWIRKNMPDFYKEKCFKRNHF